MLYHLSLLPPITAFYCADRIHLYTNLGYPAYLRHIILHVQNKAEKRFDDKHHTVTVSARGGSSLLKHEIHHKAQTVT